MAVQTLELGEQLGERAHRRLSLAQREILNLEALLEALSAFVDDETASESRAG